LIENVLKKSIARIIGREKNIFLL